MGKIYLSVILTLLGILSCCSQTGSWLWGRGSGAYYGEGVSCATDKSGSIYLTGDFVGDSIVFGSTVVYEPCLGCPHSGHGMFIGKYSPDGNVLWAHGPTARDSAAINVFSIATEANGNSYITGWYHADSMTFGNITLPSTTGSADAFFLIKYDSSGNVVWARTAGGLDGGDQGASVAIGPRNDIYVTGLFSSDSITFGTTTFYNTRAAGYTGYFVAKYDTAGIVIWAKTATTPSNTGIYPQAVSIDNNDNAYTAGGFADSTLTFGSITLSRSGYTSSYLVKYDSAGNVLWAKAFSGTSAQNYALCTDSNSIYVAGQFYGDSLQMGTFELANTSSASVFYCGYIARFTPSGNLIWAKTPSARTSWGAQLTTTANTHIYFAGGFSGDSINFEGSHNTTLALATDPLFVYKLDTNGTLLCSNTLPSGSDDIFGLAADNDENAFIFSDFEPQSMVVGPDTLLRIDTFRAGIDEAAYLAKFSCAACSDSSLNYHLSRVALCQGDSSIITFSGDTTINITPSAIVTWLSPNQALLKPDTTTLFTFSGYSSCGILHSDSFLIPVSRINLALTAPKTQFCPGDSAQICATAGFTSYNWSNGDTSTCINVSDAGNYYVTVTKNDGCTSVSNHVSISVFAAAPIAISVSGDTLKGYNAQAYQWYLNSQAIPGATASVYIENSPGIYTLQITDSNGCTEVSTPLVISGITELSEGSIGIYPNPSAGYFNCVIRGNIGDNPQINIYNSEGQLVYNIPAINQLQTLNLSAFANGVYVLHLTVSSASFTQRLVIEK